MKFFYSLIRFTKEILKIVIFIISILFSGYFILGTIYSTLFTELKFKEQIVSSISNKELTLIIFGILGTLVILGFKKILKPILSKGEFIIYLFSSYFLSHFIVKSFQFPSELVVLITLFLSVTLFFLLIQITEFFYNFNILYFKELILKERIKLGKNISQFIFDFNNKSLNFSKIIKEIIFSLLIFLSIVILITGLSGLIIFKVNQYLDYQKQLRKNFIIIKIIPKNTTYDQEVVLQGYNFGWKPNDSYRLIAGAGQINDIRLWTDNEIKFTVPLHLREGKNSIWLEKSEDDSSHSAILKSNQVNLTVISRWEFYPSQINYNDLSYPVQRENLVKKIKRFIFFKLKIGDIFSY
jgi:hypothetical protein